MIFLDKYRYFYFLQMNSQSLIMVEAWIWKYMVEVSLQNMISSK